jgi:ribosomal protein S27AE
MTVFVVRSAMGSWSRKRSTSLLRALTASCGGLVVSQRFAMGESAMLASVLHADAMPLFHARVHGVRAEAGKLIHDVDVDGQKSSPWTYREFPRREDLWGLNIHTSGEEGDCIMAAIVDYHTANPLEKAAALAAARDQVIALQANAKCVRCAKSIITVEHAQLTSCRECGARYAFAV